jgi:hypothetical protein
MAVQFSQGLRRWLPAFCVGAAVVALASLLVLTGCRRGVSDVDNAAPAHPKASLSGTVRAPEGRPTIEGRIIEAINVDTGERRRQTTRRNGGFTFKLKPGEYRIELVLRLGEALTSQPGIIDLNERADDAHADFVIEAPRVALPSDPSRYTGSSLGPPIA